jgi:hypothetical protein
MSAEEVERQYLSSPAIHVEAAELPVASQAGILAGIVGRFIGGVHVEGVVGRQALLIVCLVGLGDGDDGELGRGRGIAGDGWSLVGRTLGRARCHGINAAVREQGLD